MVTGLTATGAIAPLATPHEDAPVLSDAQQRVLAALSRRPLGLYPVESVALAAGVTPAEAAMALEHLLDEGLVTCEEETVPSRPVRREFVWKLAVAAWSRVPDVLRRTQLPAVPAGPMPERLPARFRHLFWWGDTSLYRLPRDAALVAEQILTSGDVTSWGWALRTLPSAALRRVAETPHVPEDRRLLIRDTLASRNGGTG
ncbi:MAG: hypothetical protein OXG55_10350 [bacterium]|nr:hypothetical protein [bacterium]